MKFKACSATKYFISVIFLQAIIFFAAQPARAQKDESGNDKAVVEILEKHIAAIGGRDVWRSVKTIESYSEREIFGNISKIYRVDDRETNRFYNLTESADGNTELGFDGRKVWRKTPFFKGYLEESDIQAKAVLNKRPPLYEYQKTKWKFEQVPNEIVSGKECIVLKSLETDPLEREVEKRYYFDPTTFLLRQITSGTAVKQTTTYNDYRKIDGKTIAFSMVTVNPQITYKEKYISIKYNVPVDSSKFEFSGDPNAASSPVIVSSDPIGKPSDLTETVRLETFEFVWKTVNDSYWDKTFGGIDWRALHEKYLPLIKAAAQSDEYHNLLNRMLGELKVSHFKVFPPANTGGLHSTADALKTDGVINISLRWVDSQLVVFNVKNDSPAYAAGVRKGFIVSKINGKTADELYAGYKKKNQGFQLREEIGRIRAASGELSGAPQTKATLEVIDDKNKTLILEVARTPSLGVETLKFESRRLDPNTGYIKFNLFLGDLLSKFQSALSEMNDTKTIIVDLRGNPGGVGQLAPAIANLISVKPDSLGDYIYRYENKPMFYKGAGEKAYRGQIVILVDETSGSTAEVFAAGLQENKRAIVYGMPTAGAVLPSVATSLPNGGALQYVVSNFKTPKGVVLEGRGVIPDVIAKPSRRDLLQGRDTVLEFAIEKLKKTNRN